jgi:zinc protease
MTSWTRRTAAGLLGPLALTLVLAAPCAVEAQDKPAWEGVSLDAPVPVDPRITIGYLPNGLRYYIRANERPVQRAELRLVVKVGSVVEAEDQRGVAHVLEHLAFNGSKHFAQQDLITFMESIGMRLGPGVNANTSFDETIYQLHVPTTNAEAMNKAFLFFADVAHGLTLDTEAIVKERGVVLEEWRQGRGAGARMQDQQIPILLKGSRYAERLPIGTRESLQSLEPEALRRFYKDWYRPDLMAVIAVGDFDKRDVEALIKRHFAPIPGAVGARPRPSFEVPDHPETLFAIATDREAPITSVGLYNKLPLRDQTTVGAYRQQQVERLYTTMLNSRLAELAIGANPPFLRAATDRGIFVQTKETASLIALVKEDGIERGLDALVTESARAASFGFTPGELEREKRNILRGYQGAFDEREKEESADLADEYIRNFAEREPIPGITYEFGLVQRFVPHFTVEEVNKVAKDWAGGSRVVLVNAPEKPGLAVPDGSRLAEVMKSALERDIKPYADVAAAASLMDGPPKAGAVVESTNTLAFGVTEWTLSNGAKVVLKPTEFRQDEVVFRATSPGGTSLAGDEQYVPAITAAEVVGASGVGRFDAIQLRNILSGKAASVMPFINPTSEGLAGGASPRDLETLFQLIYLSFTEPRVDENVFRVMQDQMRAMLASREASPEWALRKTLQSALTQDHPRARPMTAEMVDRMNAQQSLAFYKDRFGDASDFTFVFAGSFQPQAIKPLVEQYLGALPGIRRKESWRDEGVTPPAGVVEKTVRKGIEPKSQVTIVFTGPLNAPATESVALDALALTLENRLRLTVREALQGTYGVEIEATAQPIPSPRYSVTIDFGCDPQRADELVKSVFRDIEALRAKGPTEREVSDAREALLRRHETALARNPSLAGEIAGRYEDGEDLSTFFGLPREYQKLTTEIVRAAAQGYLDTGRYVRVTLYPEQQR